MLARMLLTEARRIAAQAVELRAEPAVELRAEARPGRREAAPALELSAEAHLEISTQDGQLPAEVVVDARAEACSDGRGAVAAMTGELLAGLAGAAWGAPAGCGEGSLRLAAQSWRRGRARRGF